MPPYGDGMTSRIAFAFLGLSILVAPAAAQADFRACLEGLRAQAAAKGVSGATYDAATRGVQPDMEVLKLMDNQPEFKTPIWDYLGFLVDEERVEDGRAAMRRHGQALAQAEGRFGVDRHIIAGVWGVESNFGKDIGKRPLIQSLATLSCVPNRRQGYFRGEFFATLKIIDDGHVRADRLTGSWAGAFGHTQFMPSTFLRLAVDLDGDGRRDVVDSVPDALGSTANFLKKAGWSSGLPWGYEVRVPGGYSGPTGRKNRRPLSAWAAAGLTRIDGRPLAGDYPAGLLMPAGANGPAFLVTKNFDALYSYNAAESYGLAIAVLSDRLRGAPGIRTPWPTDDPPLSRAERRELQRLLAARGYDVGEPDGRIGEKSRNAIKAVESQVGMRPTGRAGGKVLAALRGR
ncbi:MAG: lytic murein transglycosylase [Microvirga sp.]|jgi:lytic murein transglycosylase|nr:lytic murein transglycosylase [Microvirga sp.]